MVGHFLFQRYGAALASSGEMCKIEGGRDFYKIHPRSPLAQTGLAERQVEQSEGASKVQN